MPVAYRQPVPEGPPEPRLDEPGEAETRPGGRGPVLLRWLPVLAVIAAVLMANGPFLVGPFDAGSQLAFSGLAVSVHHGLLAGYATVDPNYDFQTVDLGHRVVLDWAHGSIPWWNPYEGVGSPLAGNMQSAAFFPPVLFLATAAGALWMHMLLEVAAGLATLALLRRLGLGRFASTAAGCAFALNGTFAWVTHAPVNVIAFLPLTLLGLEMVRDSAASPAPARAVGPAVTAAGLALSLYAGFPETAYIDGLLVALWWLARCAGLPWAAVGRFARRSAAGAAAGVLLAAPILVAFADDLHGASVGGHHGTYARFHVPTFGSFQLAFPYLAGGIKTLAAYDRSHHALAAIWDNVGGYLDTTLLVLALIGVAGRSHRALRLVLAAWSVLVAARIYGSGPATWIVDLVPGIKSTAFYRYSPVSLEFAMAVLAAFGIDDLGRLDLRRRLGTVAGAVAVTGVALAVLVHESAGLSAHLARSAVVTDWRDWSLVWGVALVALVAAAAFLPGRARVATLAALVTLDAVALFAVPEFSANRGGYLDTAPMSWLAAHAGLQRVYSVDGVMQPNAGSYYGVAQIDTNDLPVPGPWDRYVTTRLARNADALVFNGALPPSVHPSAVQSLEANVAAYRAIGVSYILAPEAQPLGRPFEPVWSDGHDRIWSLPGAAPYYSAGPGCALRPEGWNQVVATCAQPSTVIRRELDEPGWQATVGGRAVTVAASGPIFQAVAVPAGTSTVTWSFEPPHYRLSLLGPLAAVAILAGPAVARAARRRWPRRPGGGRSRYRPLHRRRSAQAPRSAASTDSPATSPVA